MSKRIILLIATLAIATIFAGCTGPTDDGETEVVNMVSGNEFDPDTLEIEVGTTVLWRNQDNVAHTTTADNGTWDSGTMNGGETFEWTFDEAGEYSYHCIPHAFENDEGEWEGMIGTIIVSEADEA